jgi:hypothetical protein
MRKSELKTGMIAETRNGEINLVMLDVLQSNESYPNDVLINLSTGCYLDLEDYTDDLTRYSSDYDIVRVYKVLYVGDIIRSIGNKKNLRASYHTLLFDRDKQKEDRIIELKIKIAEAKNIINEAETELNAIKRSK